MPLSLWVTNISQFLGFCGLTSIRMFLPTFLYFLCLRLSVIFPERFPAVLIETSQKVPSWQLSTVFLSVLGALAAAEIAAMRCAELKQFLTEDLDRFVKPLLTILALFGIISPRQQTEMNTLFESVCQVQTASFLSPQFILAFLGGGLTYFYCKIRSWLLSWLYCIDPDGSLGIQKIASSGEELFLIAVFLLLVIIPWLALIILLAGGLGSYALRKIYENRDKAHSHLCAECRKNGRETPVSDSAVICPACGSEQPDICSLRWWGLPGSRKIMRSGLSRHIFDLQKSKRCCHCAAILKKNNVCEKCGRPQWSAESVAIFKSQMRKREFAFAGLAVPALIFPLAAFLICLVLFNLFLIRPYTLYLTHTQSFISKFIFKVLNIVLLVPLLLLSTIPVAGILALVPFLCRYLWTKRQFYRNIAAYPGEEKKY